MTVSDIDDGPDVQATTEVPKATAGELTPAMLALTQRFMTGQQAAAARAAGVVAASLDGDDDGEEPDEEIAEASRVAAPEPKADKVGQARTEPDKAPDSETDGDLDDHLARLAGDQRGNRKDDLRTQLAARGVPEALAKALVSHAKARDIEAWLAAGGTVQSATDIARQPSASPAATPQPAPVARPESGLRAALAGVKDALAQSGLLEKREAESFVGALDQIVERQDRLEATLAESQQSAGRERFRSELRAAREGLAGQFPQVLDATVYRDRVAPVLEALVTSAATGGRPLAENLAAACRAALSDVTDADRVSRELERNEGSRRQLKAPTTRTKPETISGDELAKNLLNLRLQGGGSREDMLAYAERYKGRVR